MHSRLAVCAIAIVCVACSDEAFVDEADGSARDAAQDVSATGDASDAATQADATTVNDAAGEARCAFGKGAPMVRVQTASGAFCMDTLEVTEAEFAQFASSLPNPWVPNDAGLCTGGTSSSDFSATPLATDTARGGAYPVGAKWCAARAYCAWAGKRLCATNIVNSADVGEFAAGCSGNFTQTFGYGNTLDTNACDAGDAGAIYPVGSVPTCTGGVPGTFDVNGNRQEWVDGFGTTDGGPNVYRDVRGLGGTANCTTPHGVPFDSVEVGFRCCADSK